MKIKYCVCSLEALELKSDLIPDHQDPNILVPYRVFDTEMEAIEYLQEDIAEDDCMTIIKIYTK